MKISVDKLQHHPLNRLIYNLSDIDSLVESISQVGLLQPLTVNQNFQVISGNRRFESIKRLGWKEVEVNQIEVNTTEEILLLIHFNKQRVKTIKELLSEYDHLRYYYKSDRTEKVKNVREIVADDIKISDGQLARILFIRKHNPEMIDLIDKGILTVNQSYLQSQRSVKEHQSLTGLIDIENNENVHRDNFTFYQKSSNKMDEIGDGEIQTIFTSPPYYKKRLYYGNGGLGNEKTHHEFVDNLVDHLKDCYRVLNKRGSFFLNLGDTFVDGNLQNIPHRVILKLQEQNWILRNTIIFKKTNPKPSSSKSNLTPSYEFIFHLVKSLNYEYEPTFSPISQLTKPSLPPRHRTDKIVNSKTVSPYFPDVHGKNMGDYWDESVVKSAVANQTKYNGVEHPAMFPEQIVYLPILQTSVYPFLGNGGINSKVIDPFAGSLTVFDVVTKINKEYGTNLNFIGYDVKKYFK